MKITSDFNLLVITEKKFSYFSTKSFIFKVLNLWWYKYRVLAMQRVTEPLYYS